MIPSQIHCNIVRVDTPAVYAYYIVKSKTLYPLALVCDENDILIGVIGNNEISYLHGDLTKKTCGELCTSEFKYLVVKNDQELYRDAREIFAISNIKTLPVVDSNRIPQKLFGKFQAFFINEYKTLPYFIYAHGVFQAAKLAKSRGYNQISVIEFGVAGGLGLSHLGIYSREVQKITGVEIDIYGFDSGIGLYKPNDYRDCPNMWIEGDYKTNLDTLKSTLYNEQLIIGDICETTKSFLDEYNPAPIGFISIDVDHYTPTVAILKMLLGNDKFFLPTITMYFDDVYGITEFQGESLAIKEFNTLSNNVKISPEGLDFQWVHTEAIKHLDDARLYFLLRLKWCNRFNHPRYCTSRKKVKNMNI